MTMRTEMKSLNAVDNKDMTGKNMMELQKRIEQAGVFRAAMMAVVMMFVIAAVMAPQEAHAWPTKYTSCSSCHSATEPTATMAVAIDAVQTTSVTVAPGASFEVDFIGRNIAGAAAVGMEVAVPTGWTIAAGTSNAPALTGWNTVWDVASGAVWSGNKNTPTTPYDTSGEFPSSPSGFTVNFAGTGWTAVTATRPSTMPVVVTSMAPPMKWAQT
jgi:hypothetical protein